MFTFSLSLEERVLDSIYRMGFGESSDSAHDHNLFTAFISPLLLSSRIWPIRLSLFNRDSLEFDSIPALSFTSCPTKNCDLNLYWSAVLVEALIVCGILGVVFFSIFSFSIDLTLLLISGFVFRVLDFVKASQERMSTHLRLLKLEQISFFLANGLIAIGAIGGGGLGFYLFGSF